MTLNNRDRRNLSGADPEVERLAVSIPDATIISGLSRSEIYRQLAAGDIRAVKAGARTLILMDSLRAHLASLPPATFRTKRAGRTVEAQTPSAAE
jgi:hypothetical protein